MVIYSLQSRTYRKLTEKGGYPEWLADSRRLLFWRLDATMSWRINWPGALHLVDSQTEDVREVLRPTPGGAMQYYGLSADKRWIYFTHVKSEADIWLHTLPEGN